MKKPITIGVIAVIATILVTSAVDYSAIGAKPIDQFHLETTGITDGIVSCPNGDDIELTRGSVHFTEDIEGDKGGYFQDNGVSRAFGVTLWNGSVQSNQFSFTGIGNASTDLTADCNETMPVERTIVTVWGECGQNVTVHFDSELGYSGSLTGNVLCV